MKSICAVVIIVGFLLSVPASAQKGGEAIELPPEHIQVTLEQPADFIIQVDSIEYKSPELEASFVPELLQSVTAGPF